MSAEFWWTVGSTLALVIFNAGVMYKMIKDKPSLEKVTEIIDEKLEGHCPIIHRVVELEDYKREGIQYREKIAKELSKEIDQSHSSLQEIKMNLKNVCIKLKVDYIDANGHK